LQPRTSFIITRTLRRTPSSCSRQTDRRHAETGLKRGLGAFDLNHAAGCIPQRTGHLVLTGVSPLSFRPGDRGVVHSVPYLTACAFAARSPTPRARGRHLRRPASALLNDAYSGIANLSPWDHRLGTCYPGISSAPSTGHRLSLAIRKIARNCSACMLRIADQLPARRRHAPTVPSPWSSCCCCRCCCDRRGANGPFPFKQTRPLVDCQVAAVVVESIAQSGDVTRLHQSPCLHCQAPIGNHFIPAQTSTGPDRQSHFGCGVTRRLVILSSSPTSLSTGFPPRRRKPLNRIATCRSASSASRIFTILYIVVSGILHPALFITTDRLKAPIADARRSSASAGPNRSSRSSPCRYTNRDAGALLRPDPVVLAMSPTACCPSPCPRSHPKKTQTPVRLISMGSGVAIALIAGLSPIGKWRNWSIWARSPAFSSWCAPAQRPAQTRP